ncbi:hypothetical protein [Lentzea sp. NPDC055074]
MVLSGGWRVFASALLLSAGVLAPATAVADPVADPVAACRSWDFVELPVPPAVRSEGVAAAAGSFAVGTGSFWSMSGSTALVWKDGQLLDQLSFFRNPTSAQDINSSGVVILSASLFPAAARWRPGVPDSVQGLQGLPGEYRVEAFDLNERGDVLGRSDGKPVVWPADSAVPHQVPGTDASWSPVGIADDGSVLAGSSGGTHWIRPSGEVVSLGNAEVRTVRGNHAVGVVDSQVVRWDVTGAASEPYAFAAEVLAANSHGHVLGRTLWGDKELWADPSGSRAVPTVPAYPSLTDEGDIYGASSTEPGSVPLLLDCSGGV